MPPRPRKTQPKVTQAALDQAALYVRVSTEEQADEGFGLDVQRQQVTAYAVAFGLSVAAEYADEGVSGTKGLADRPQLAAAIKAAKQRQYTTLIVPAIDRLARRAGLLLQIWDELESAGVSIVAVKERIDTSTPAGRLMRTMFAGVAEFERDSIVARTTDGRNQRGRKDGEKGGRMPYGYQRSLDGPPEVDAQAAAVVRRIFAERKRKLSYQAIATALNQDRVPTPQGGANWYAMTVKVIIDNRAYYKGGQRGESPIHWPAIL